MHGPDGVNYKNRIVYVEIVQSERIVHGHSGGDGDQADVHFETSVTFIDPGNGNTELRLRSRFDSDEELTMWHCRHGTRRHADGYQPGRTGAGS